MKSNYLTTTADQLGVGSIVDNGDRFWHCTAVYAVRGDGVLARFHDGMGNLRSAYYNQDHLIRLRTQPTPLITSTNLSL